MKDNFFLKAFIEMLPMVLISIVLSLAGTAGTVAVIVWVLRSLGVI